MKRLLTASVLIFGVVATADADVWMWVDAKGNTHFVDTMKPIYTWMDEFGKVHYSDTPEHEDAVSVELVWHSAGTLDDVEGNSASEGTGTGSADPDETPAERAEREQAEAYYCKRATEIYDSYTNAPQLYRTNDAGEREYLSKEEAAKTIADTRARMEELCQ